MKQFSLLLPLLIAGLILQGCGPKTEEDRFIAASVEITCEVIKDPSISLDPTRNKELSQEIFKDYDFPVEDNESMLGLLDKYEQNTEIQEKINELVEKGCK